MSNNHPVQGENPRIDTFESNQYLVLPIGTRTQYKIKNKVTKYNLVHEALRMYPEPHYTPGYHGPYGWGEKDGFWISGSPDRPNDYYNCLALIKLLPTANANSYNNAKCMYYGSPNGNGDWYNIITGSGYKWLVKTYGKPN